MCGSNKHAAAAMLEGPRGGVAHLVLPLLLVLGCVGPAVAGADLAGAPDGRRPITEILEIVQRDWARRQQQINHVSTILSGTEVISRGGISKSDFRPTPLTDTLCPFEREWRIDFQRARLRRVHSGSAYVDALRAWHPRHITSYSHRGLVAHATNKDPTEERYIGDSAPSVRLTRNRRAATGLFSVLDYPILYARGVALTGETSDGEAAESWTDSSWIAEAEVYRRPRSASAVGREVVLVRCPSAGGKPGSRFELVVDLSRQSAVVAARSYVDGPLRFQIDIVECQLVGGWWMPKRWKVAVYDEQGDLVRGATVVAPRMAVNDSPPDEAFAVPLAPGMVAIEDGFPRRVGANGRTLEPLAPRIERPATVRRVWRTRAGTLGMVLVTIVCAASHFAQGDVVARRGNGQEEDDIGHKATGRRER